MAWVEARQRARIDMQADSLAGLRVKARAVVAELNLMGDDLAHAQADLLEDLPPLIRAADELLVHQAPYHAAWHEYMAVDALRAALKGRKVTWEQKVRGGGIMGEFSKLRTARDAAEKALQPEDVEVAA